MNLYQQFKTNEGIEKSGLLLNYGENSKGAPINIRVARAGGANRKFEKVADIKLKPYRRQIQQGLISNAAVEKLLVEIYAESVVIGWENVEDADGNPMAFSVENCVKLLTDLPDLFKDIQDQAQRGAIFRDDIAEADIKN
jgi:hypothetical protein